MKKPEILVVDDSPMNRDILSSILIDSYEITEAENGVQAIKILENRGYKFSLVLLDIVMPEIDGYGVLSYMNKCGLMDDLPVIVISSETSHNVVNKAYDMGAMGFISRPFDLYIVRRRIENAITLNEKNRKLTDIAADEIYERIQIYDRMISVLGQIVEFRSEGGGSHVTHINRIAGMFANQLAKKTDKYNLSESDITMISMASSLHDIGKIVIPGEILNKPGRLTDDEFEIVKTHSAQGAGMLKNLTDFKNDPMFKMAYEICMWHHERYDGTGYPDGLKGDDIPISAQIVAIADVYDALTAERCYKNAYSPEEAAQMILNGECGAFNPLLLECLSELSGKLAQMIKAENAGFGGEQYLPFFTEEISRRDELSFSNRILREMWFEQSRADYFEEALNKMTFVYKCHPQMLILSPESARRLGLNEITPKPDSDEFMCKNCGMSCDEWLDRKAQISPRMPDFVLEGSFLVDGKQSLCRCDCHSVWSKEEEPEYLGTVGCIMVLQNEAVFEK